MAWMTFGALQAREVRDRLFQDLLDKEVEWYETHTSGIGALLPRLQTSVRFSFPRPLLTMHRQISDLQMATSQPLGFVAQNIISSLASLGVAFYYSWKLTMVTMSTVPIAFIVLGLLSTLIHPSMRDQDAQLNYAAKCAHSALISIGVVKGFNAQEHEAQHYSMYVKQAAAYYRKQAHSNAVQMGFVRVFTLAMFVQGYWYGHHLVAEHALSFADVTTTFWACLLATKAFEEILPQMLVLERGRAAGMSLKTLLEQVTKEPVREPSQRGKTPKFCDGDIEFRNVS